MSSTETRQSHYVAGHGTYTYDPARLAEQLARPKPELLAEVIDRCADRSGDRTAFRKFRKLDLAAMLADFATATDDNERETARLIAARNAARIAADRKESGHGREIGIPYALAIVVNSGGQVRTGVVCPVCDVRLLTVGNYTGNQRYADHFVAYHAEPLGTCSDCGNVRTIHPDSIAQRGESICMTCAASGAFAS